MNLKTTQVKAVVRVMSVGNIVELLRRPGLDFGCAPVARENPPGVYNLTLFNPTDEVVAGLRAEGFLVTFPEQQDGPDD